MVQSRAVASEHFFSAESSTSAYTHNRWFEAIPADTPELREKAFRLRYQVYCREKQFETPDEHPFQMERDIYDSRALHSLVIDRHSGAATGTVRLILPDERSPEISFPIQQVCQHPLPTQSLTSTAAEISRFAISKKIRKMAEQAITPVLINSENPAMAVKAMKCSITLLLMREIVRTSRVYSITDWFAVMEPALLRLLSRFGIHFAPIGPPVEYHGTRQPCHAKADELLERMRQEQPNIWSFIATSRIQ